MISNWIIMKRPAARRPGFIGMDPTVSGTAPLAGNPPAGAPSITSPLQPVYILGSGSPFSLILMGSNGGAFTASGLPGWLILFNGVLGGTPPAASVYQFTVTTTNASGSSSAIVTLEVLASHACRSNRARRFPAGTPG